MKLTDFDGKTVKITFDDGTVFEGECAECSAEYCFAEFGREEEALQKKKKKKEQLHMARQNRTPHEACIRSIQNG